MKELNEAVKLEGLAKLNPEGSSAFAFARSATVIAKAP